MNPLLLSTQSSSFTCHNNFFHHQVVNLFPTSNMPSYGKAVLWAGGNGFFVDLITNGTCISEVSDQEKRATSTTVGIHNIYYDMVQHVQQPSPCLLDVHKPFKCSHLQFNSDICQLNVVYLFFKCLH